MGNPRIANSILYKFYSNFPTSSCLSSLRVVLGREESQSFQVEIWFQLNFSHSDPSYASTKLFSLENCKRDFAPLSIEVGEPSKVRARARLPSLETRPIKKKSIGKVKQFHQSNDAIIYFAESWFLNSLSAVVENFRKTPRRFSVTSLTLPVGREDTWKSILHSRREIRSRSTWNFSSRNRIF